jgi:hypothetical protein
VRSFGNFLLDQRRNHQLESLASHLIQEPGTGRGKFRIKHSSKDRSIRINPESLSRKALGHFFEFSSSKLLFIL